MIPFYRNLVIHKDLYSVHGGFIDWTYEHLGIFSFTNELWNNAQLLGQPPGGGPTCDRGDRRDRRGRRSSSPTTGCCSAPTSSTGTRSTTRPTAPIEIGGFVKQSQRVPPPFLIEELCHRNAAFVLYHADQMPLLDWEDLRSSRSGETCAVTASVANARAIPTRSAQARRRKIGLPDRFTHRGRRPDRRRRQAC